MTMTVLFIWVVHHLLKSTVPPHSVADGNLLHMLRFRVSNQPSCQQILTQAVSEPQPVKHIKAMVQSRQCGRILMPSLRRWLKMVNHPYHHLVLTLLLDSGAIRNVQVRDFDLQDILCCHLFWDHICASCLVPLISYVDQPCPLVQVKLGLGMTYWSFCHSVLVKSRFLSKYANHFNQCQAHSSHKIALPTSLLLFRQTPFASSFGPNSIRNGASAPSSFNRR